MKMLSKTFRSLLESMKSPYNEMDEDREARVEKREERRRERREDKFGVSTNSTDGTTTEVEGSSDFKIRPFMRAVDQLKSQVQSEIFNIKQTLDNREAGYESARKYESKINTIMEIIKKITSKMEEIKDKEGRNLESNDLADIKIFRGLYSTASNDFLAAQKEWKEKKLEAETKYLSDLKDTDTNNFIFDANKAFAEAEAILDELIRISQVQVNDKKAGDKKGAENLATGDVIKAGKKYANDSKEGKIVIEVKKTIYKKFKSKLGTKKDWEVVYKSGAENVSGSLLGNTQALIVMIKGGLFKTGKYPQFESDKGGDITTAFIEAINGLTESQSNSFGKLITFENFIKRHVNEDFEFDIEGADQALKDFKKSSGSSNNNSGTSYVKKKEYSETTFSNDTEGNKFREWVIKNKAEWAKTNDLSASGPKNNNYIRKAYAEFGKEYEKSIENSGNKNNVKEAAEKCEKYLISASYNIQLLFKEDNNFWQEFKSINDNEDDAVVAFKEWWNSTLVRKYLNKAKDLIPKITNKEEKELCNKNYYRILNAKDKIVKKLYGGTSDDIFYWKIYKIDGKIKSYKIDTDF
jgi:hypothetical protein